MDTKYPIKSEIVEPTMSYILSRLWKQVEEEQRPECIEDVCLSLWLGMKAINRLSTVCNSKRPGAVHFSISCGNEMGRIAEYIKEKCGFNPWFDDENETVKRWNSCL